MPRLGLHDPSRRNKWKSSSSESSFTAVKSTDTRAQDLSHISCVMSMPLLVGSCQWLQFKPGWVYKQLVWQPWLGPGILGSPWLATAGLAQHIFTSVYIMGDLWKASLSPSMSDQHFIYRDTNCGKQNRVRREMVTADTDLWLAEWGLAIAGTRSRVCGVKLISIFPLKIAADAAAALLNLRSVLTLSTLGFQPLGRNHYQLFGIGSSGTSPHHLSSSCSTLVRILIA